MIAGADSSGYQPSSAQLQAAYTAGCRVWGGYLPGPSIYSGHSQAYFARLKAGGMTTIAFCSGHADPGQQKVLGAAWGVDFLCLDVESGIRGDGPWVQPWLDTSGAGLYGNPPVFAGRRAPFFIMANYQGTYPNYQDPQATWQGPAPAVPHGWQWAGSVNAYGGSVDKIWLDDWFAQGEQNMPLTLDEARALVRVTYMAALGREPESEATLDGAAKDAMANGYEQMATRILDSTEGQAWHQKISSGGSSKPAPFDATITPK